MSTLDDLLAEPWRFDFFSILRQAERHFSDKPRIGHSMTLDQDAVRLGQDPFMAFPASTIGRATVDPGGQLHLYPKFLGMLGPQGALPIATTEEVWQWGLTGDEAFARFLDIFEHRFLQLFFRAWADARPIAQHDRPDSDRFLEFFGSAIGLGSPPFRNNDCLPDLAKLAYGGLMSSKMRSAERIEALIAGLFDLEVEVEQFVGCWLETEPDERSHIGKAQSVLGQSLVIGSAIYSVEDKITIRLHARDLDQYQDFLPSGPRCAAMTDAIFFYVGPEIDWDVEITLPVAELRPTKLGVFGRLGWTSWIAPPDAADSTERRADAHFHPMSRRSTKRPAT